MVKRVGLGDRVDDLVELLQCIQFRTVSLVRPVCAAQVVALKCSRLRGCWACADRRRKSDGVWPHVLRAGRTITASAFCDKETLSNGPTTPSLPVSIILDLNGNSH